MADRVLMIEDDDSLSSLVAEYLGGLGMRVTVRASASERLAALRHGGFDALVLASRLDTIAGPEGTEDVDLLALVAGEGARSGADVSGDPVTVRGDPRLLRRLARNLLENARRHAPDAPAEAIVRARAPGGAWLRVADRGPGVPESERERIFEPFYRLPASERQESGSGLGLALVRRIARRHGGEVRCLPRDGGGTVFEVELPGG